MCSDNLKSKSVPTPIVIGATAIGLVAFGAVAFKAMANKSKNIEKLSTEKDLMECLL